MINLNLSQKTALVCGGSQGIGAAIAKELADLGASVILLARNEEKLRQVLGSLNTQQGQKHSFVAADLKERQQTLALVEKHLQTHQYRVEILVNNSGGPAPGLIQEEKPEKFLEIFDQHLLMSSELTRLLLPGMKERGFGRIINILSTSVKAPLAQLGVSNTVRWAVASWAKTLAQEVASAGITVNCILPGATETERLTQLITNKSRKENVDYSDEEKKMKMAIPMQRFGRPEEIAQVAAFFCTPAAAYVTGVALCVDGGRTPCL